MKGYGGVTTMGSIQSKMEQIPGAEEAPNLARRLTGGPGVGGRGRRRLVWQGGTQLVGGPLVLC